MQSIIKFIIYPYNGSRIMLCSLIFCANLLFSQTFIRYSNDVQYGSVILANKNRTATIDRSNFKTFIFQEGDKVLLGDKLLDFSVSNDTLYILDRVKELDEIKIVKEDFTNKVESSFKSSQANAYADLTSNNRIATLIKIDQRKKTFIRSITLFPKDLNNPTGKLQIEVLPNINGLPDNESPIISFEKSFSEITPKKWEIIFPRPILYPENGCFIVFYHKAEIKKWNATLRLNADSHMYMYYPQSDKWKRLSFNAYYFKLKVLQ